LILEETKMLKANQLLSGRDMEAETRDGQSPTLTKLLRKPRRVLTPTSDSISTDHSISDPDSQ
jgi:hypothetical protein